jgi:hypothetical protein
MPRRLRPRPLDPIIDFSLTGCDGSFAGAEFCRSLNLPIAGKYVPVPKAGFDFLNVIIDGAMLHSIRSLPEELQS